LITKKKKLMKNLLQQSVTFWLFVSLFLISGDLYSQTQGTFSFSVTTTAPSGQYGTKNVLAIWIQNSAAAFIKTKIMYCASDNLDHLDTWVTKSGQNVTDAVTGNTRSSHGNITFLWNGKNSANTLVPDGSYNVWLEMAWDEDLVTEKTVNSFSFTKGTLNYHSTPANTANFLSPTLDWTPLSTGVEGVMESKDIIVYPNPSAGLVNINFKQSVKECLIQIINEAGRIEYNENISDLQAGIRTLDLTRLQGGIYYCTLHLPDKDIVFSILLVK
jgi:hypothetical protein